MAVRAVGAASAALLSYSQPYVLARSHVAASGAADTNENTLATITIPGGAMGPNGFVRIMTLWSQTNNANVKTVRVKFGGTNFLGLPVTSTATTQIITTVRNRNSASSQVGYAIDTASNFGSTTSAAATSAVNTGSDVTVLLTVQKATAGDTMTLEGYIVEVVYGA